MFSEDREKEIQLAVATVVYFIIQPNLFYLLHFEQVFFLSRYASCCYFNCRNYLVEATNLLNIKEFLLKENELLNWFV